MSYKNLREWIDKLQQEGDLAVVDAPVDPCLELAEIHRRILDDDGPALLFTNVKGTPFPVVTNMFGSARRVEMAFGAHPERLADRLVDAVHRLLPASPKFLWNERGLIREVLKIGVKHVSRKHAPVLQVCLEKSPLRDLPKIRSWQHDAGPYISMPMVYTENPLQPKASHLGIYRVQLFDDQTAGVHWEIQKGGGFHYFEAEQLHQPLPVSIFIGGPPAMIASAIAPVPEHLSELLMASFLLGDKIAMAVNPYGGYSIPAELEFAISGFAAPFDRRPGGSFGDRFGYYTLEQQYPLLRVSHMWHRKDAIYPATIVGKPRQEDYYLGDFLQKLFSPLIPVVMPGVRALWTYADCGVHALSSAVIRESYSREALVSAFRILGEGQLSLTKMLMVTDKKIELADFRLLLKTVLERFDPQRDLYIMNNTSQDPLDFTGEQMNRGSKAIWIGVGEPVRDLPFEYHEGDIAEIDQIEVFDCGCLVVSGASYEKEPELAERLLQRLRARETSWPLVVLADHAAVTAHDQIAFLWTVFTRFNPAIDMYAAADVRQHHLAYSLPIVIDARTKPGYPEELFPSKEIVSLVDERWKSYFM